MLVDAAVGVFVGDAVVDPAIALAAASGVDEPGEFRQRSTAADVAATAIASIGSADVVLIVDIVGVVGVVAEPGDAAPSPSATLALDCRAIEDVGGVV